MMKNFFETNEKNPAIQRAKMGKRSSRWKIPEEWSHTDLITVYRAGIEEIEEAGNKVPWTTNKGLAFWMYQNKKEPKYVFQAQIDPQDVLMYTEKKYQFEVHQYQAVRNITDITEEAQSDDGIMLSYDFEEDYFDWWDNIIFEKYSDD